MPEKKAFFLQTGRELSSNVNESEVRHAFVMKEKSGLVRTAPELSLL
jgi:hypothetical protein